MAIRRTIFMPQARCRSPAGGRKRHGVSRSRTRPRAGHAGMRSPAKAFAENKSISPSQRKGSAHAPQHRAQLSFHIGLTQRGLSGLPLGDDDNIRPVRNVTDVMPKKFSQQPFDSVAQDGLADLAGNGRSQTRRGGAVAPPIADENKKMFRMETPARLIACRIVGAPDDAALSRPCPASNVSVRIGGRGLPLFHNQALRRLRPLARRRRSTARPLGVAIRARKP